LGVIRTDVEGDRFYTIPEVARILRVSDQSVRRWIKAGELRATKPGKEYRIGHTNLEEFLRAREPRPKAGGRSPFEPSFYDILEETAVAITAWWIGGERYNVVKWNVPLEERGRYRDRLREMFPNEDYIEVAFGARPQEEAERIMAQISKAFAQAS
jgi:excisionase family DNA binding protein